MRLILIAAALAAAPLAAFAAPPAAVAQAVQQVAPRQTVQAAAARIRDLYFDAAKGERLAAELEAEAASGRYDALTDGRDLAAALSTRLRPEDAHFNVVYDPNPPAAASRQPGPRPAFSPLRYRNQGFRRMEILPGNIGYIEMTQFAEIDFDDPADPARRAVEAALAFVADADAVIIDLRDNGGGAPSMVGYITSAFTPAGAGIYNVFHSREGTRSEAPGVFYPTPRLEVPLYILTSGRTGSAGEALPYTLQAARRATIVGEATGGAANPGGMVPLGDGFALFVSGGSPRNPLTGGNWEGTGVQPDVVVPWDQALVRAQVLALQTIAAADRPDATWALEALNAAPPAEDLTPYVGTYGEQSVRLADGRLSIQRGRRPTIMLLPLGDGLFSVWGDPSRRYRFERGPDGAVIAVEGLTAGGPSTRTRRAG